MDKYSIITSDIDAVIFDMDGTIIDSMHVWRDIDIEYFKKYGKTLPDTYQKDIEGFSVIETARYTKETFGFEASIEDMDAFLEKVEKNFKYAIKNANKILVMKEGNVIELSAVTVSTNCQSCSNIIPSIPSCFVRKLAFNLIANLLAKSRRCFNRKNIFYHVLSLFNCKYLAGSLFLYKFRYR